MSDYVPWAILKVTRPERYEQQRVWFNNYNQNRRDANVEKWREYSRANYAQNRESILARKRKWSSENPQLRKAMKERSRQKNRATYMLQNSKSNAKKKGIAFDLTLEWFQERLTAGVCEMSGLPFNFVEKLGKDSPSIDRRIPGGPYTQANCRMVLWSINRALVNYGEDYVLGVFRQVLDRRV